MVSIINMLSLNIYTPEEVARHIANSAKQQRLAKNMSRKTLAVHSGVSLGSIQRFEQTGKISLENLLNIAQALSSLADFQALFQLAEPTSIQEIKQHEAMPKRGRL